MNTDKPDFNEIAKEYALKLVDEAYYEGGPHFICFKNGMEYIWENYFTPLQSKISSLESDRERLLSALKDVMKIVVNNETHHGYRNTANKLITEIESK